MNCRRRMGSVSPNAHKRKEASRTVNSVSKHTDTKPTDRPKRGPGKLEVEGAAKVIRTK